LGWFKIIRWIVYALTRAEELEITQSNVQNIAKDGRLDQKEFLKAAALSAAELKLDPDWLIRVLQSVGNYSEIYDRNLGEASGLNVPRRLNALISESGLRFAPAFR